MIIVQIGTNTASWHDGTTVREDSCLSFVKKNKHNISFLHLIEPLTSCNESILNSYNFLENKKIHNIAITENENLNYLKIYFPKNRLTSGHASSKLNHLHQHGHSEIDEVIVSSLTLDKFFDTQKIYKCDRLFIDTEGLDCLILLKLDFKKYEINYIDFEIAHSDGPFSRGEVYKKCIDKLKFEGYNIRTSEQDSLNIIAEKL